MPTGIVRMGSGSVGWAFRNQIIEGDQHPILNNFDGWCAFNMSRECLRAYPYIGERLRFL